MTVPSMAPLLRRFGGITWGGVADYVKNHP